MGGTASPPPVAVPPMPTRYDFETDTEGWRDLKNQNTSLRRATNLAATGGGSLAVDISTRGRGNDGEANSCYVGLDSSRAPLLSVGQTLTMQLWIPVDAQLLGLQPFVVTMDGDWKGTWSPGEAVTRGAWTTVSIRVPDGFAVGKLEWMGVQFITRNGGWSGTVYVDNVVVR